MDREHNEAEIESIFEALRIATRAERERFVETSATDMKPTFQIVISNTSQPTFPADT